MFQAIIKMSECRSSVVRRVDVNAFHLASELMFERLKGEQVVAVNQPVVENVVFTDAMRGMIRFGWVFEQDARLQLWPVLLSDPSQFESWFA